MLLLQLKTLLSSVRSSVRRSDEYFITTFSLHFCAFLELFSSIFIVLGSLIKASCISVSRSDEYFITIPSFYFCAFLEFSSSVFIVLCPCLHRKRVDWMSSSRVVSPLRLVPGFGLGSVGLGPRGSPGSFPLTCDLTSESPADR